MPSVLELWMFTEDLKLKKIALIYLPTGRLGSNGKVV